MQQKVRGEAINHDIKVKNKSENSKLPDTTDSKFAILYERIHKMASDQAEFNLTVKAAIDRLNEPIQTQIDYMQKENDLIQHELERTQNNNRELLNAFRSNKDGSNAVNLNNTTSCFKCKFIKLKCEI